MSVPAPTFDAITVLPQSGQNRVLHLKSVRIHRFAGIHPFGQLEQPPEEFFFEIESPLTIIEGMNGAGKTSLLSAITWCLTGKIYRSQRPPEDVESCPIGMSCDPNSNDPQDGYLADISTITPLPPKSVLKSLDDNIVPLDTWVELILSDSHGNDHTIRRRVERTRSAKITISQPDLSSLGLDPIALEVGTRMPGDLPFIQLDRASDLGKAVASLTGLRPLKDLAIHAKKVKDKLEKDFVKERNLEIQGLDKQFHITVQELNRILEEHQDIQPQIAVPASLLEKDLEKKLESLTKHFESLQSASLKSAQQILGVSFNPEDQAARQKLTQKIGPAQGLLDRSHLGNLPSSSRLYKLGSLANQELCKAEGLLGELKSQATELARISHEPKLAARLRLYAKVASWLKDSKFLDEITECPICHSPLMDKVDSITGKPICEHILHFLSVESAYLERTIEAWEKNSIQRLGELADPLKSEIEGSLPPKPANLILNVIDELFSADALSDVLMPLKASVRDLCTREIANLPEYSDPEEVSLPGVFSTTEGSFHQKMQKVVRAISFARWRHGSSDSVKQLFQKVLVPPESFRSELQRSEWPLADLLSELSSIVRGAAPLGDAILKLQRLGELLLEGRKKENRIDLYKVAAESIQGLLALDSLVEKLVGFLMKTLQSETMRCKECLYKPAFMDAPKVVSTDVQTDGSLSISAELGGTVASARHISNSSDLKATLLALLISFWKYLLDKRGGLSLLLFDDLQELFDPENRRRVANEIPNWVKEGARPIITTNDSRFRQRMQDSAAGILRGARADHRQIHPPKANRDHIELGRFKEEIQTKREEFVSSENRNKHQPARDYINYLRIYLENHLMDFFDSPEPDLPKKPGLSDLINALRKLVRRGSAPFFSHVFEELISHPSLDAGSDFLKIMNLSHHGRQQEITFNDVWELRNDCSEVLKLVGNAYSDYEHYLRGDLRDAPSGDSSPTMPDPISFPTFSVPMLTHLAAFTEKTPAGDVVQSDEAFTADFLTNHALYLINTHNLGPSGPINSRAIVDLSDDGFHNSLAVVLHGQGVYARRVFRLPGGKVILVSEAENPLKRPPPLILVQADVQGTQDCRFSI